MTNIERLKQMDVDDFTDWLVHQFWPDLDPYMDTIGYSNRWHAVRNFLLDTYKELADDSK